MDIANPKINRKAIILAGGLGKRLSPITRGISKQLLPIYNKPMIYYPLSILMLTQIKEYLIICNPWDLENFRSLLNDGKDWGIDIKYAIQEKPNGIAEAFLIGESFIKNSPVALILGDNLFYGQNLTSQLRKANCSENSTIFAYAVNDPERYGVVNFDKKFNALKIEEKPKKPKSNFAIAGLYFYDNQVTKIARNLVPSQRGELEITDINNYYLNMKKLKVELLGRGTAWLDTGTFDSLLDASLFIKTLEERQSLKIGYPEEISLRNGWINKEKFIQLSNQLKYSEYGKYLIDLSNNF